MRVLKAPFGVFKTGIVSPRKDRPDEPRPALDFGVAEARGKHAVVICVERGAVSHRLVSLLIRKRKRRRVLRSCATTDARVFKILSAKFM